MVLARVSLAALLALLSFSSASQSGGAVPQEGFLCPPCGAECHFVTYPKAGKCGGCGMDLVSLSSVPQVGVLLFPNARLPTSLLTLSLFAGSNEVRAFCVADTNEPLRLFDTLEVRPQFAFAEAPPLDVLVVPDGYGAWDDPMLVEWVKATAEHARFVLSVGSGSIVLARAGFLAKETVPAAGYFLRGASKLAPELVFDGALAWRRADKFFLARDPESALDATLAIVQELAGEEAAKRTAEEFGHPWKPAAK